MKPADCSSKPRAPARRTARANSAVRSGLTCLPRARPRSSREVGRGEHAFAQPSPPIRPPPLDHLLDMRDRGFRLDAVPEVEDQSAAGVIFQYVVDGAIQRGTPAD